MGTNTSKPSTYATSSHGSACMGGLNNSHSYPNGPARMGGVHPKKRKPKKDASSNNQRQTSNLDPDAILLGDRNQSTQPMLQLSEEDTNLNKYSEPPPPYSR